MTFDPTVPTKLKQTQKWFAGIITRPIDQDSRMNPISPKGKPMEDEAWDFIKPSPTLRPAQRIELYNQQYWWRLLSVMQENFPFLTRLFGYQEFNRAIAFPYIVKSPSSHWSLNRLGSNLLKWIDKEYQASDKELISIAATLDWAYCCSFSAAESAPLRLNNLPIEGDVDSLLKVKLYLQPHIKLFSYKADYFQLRFDMLTQSVEHWIENDFPLLASENKKYYFILFRDKKTNLVWNQLSEAEYTLLSRFQKGATIDECCDWLEKQRKKSLKEANEYIPQWFKEWVAKRWLTLENNQSGSKYGQRQRKK